jgi:hypothetical protein
MAGNGFTAMDSSPGSWQDVQSLSSEVTPSVERTGMADSLAE